jgi:hypothetical protein
MYSDAGRGDGKRGAEQANKERGTICGLTTRICRRKKPRVWNGRGSHHTRKREGAMVDASQSPPHPPCTGIFLLAECCVLEYSYWLNMLYWNIPTGWICCTRIFLLTEYFILECSKEGMRWLLPWAGRRRQASVAQCYRWQPCRQAPAVRASSVRNSSNSVRNISPSVRNVSTSVRNISTVRARSVRKICTSVRNISTPLRCINTYCSKKYQHFSKKYQYSESEFSKKYQFCSKKCQYFRKKYRYSESEFSKKCQYSSKKC